ncbi:hypothetical protein [Salinivibrio proteolyticus]|uniref:hypothetical protein n=1 Tax=Salinivibrio proteolyticus TaxID=334715 RepID=UPI000988C7A8|nr:hypothetical protein [Salinivibrio proteolyticus]OOF28950.1 hypothetical protein BZJ20_15580 [Salinivibrio proteolyticus]
MDIGYSTELKKEVSVRDYLSLLGINPERQINVGDMDDTLLTFIRHDICCPSCGVSGASVRCQSDNAGQSLWQFLFVDQENQCLHEPDCWFKASQSEGEVCKTLRLDKTPSNNTVFIQSLLHKAIERNLLTQDAIFDFKRWFFHVKSNNLVKLTITPDKLKHYYFLYCRKASKGDAFHPKMSELSTLKWDVFGRHRVALLDNKLSETIAHHHTSYISKAELSAFLQKSATLFDVRVLSYEYKVLLSIKMFAVTHMHLVVKDKEEDAFLDAFLCLLLFVNRWHYHHTLSMLIDLHNAPQAYAVPSFKVLGLSPFCHYPFLSSVLNINEVSDRLLSEQALKREIIEQIAYLKKESLYWNSSPSTPANRLD